MSQVPSQDAWAAEVAKYQDAYDKSEEFGDRWVPPVGENYTAVITKIRKGMSKAKDGKPSMPYWGIGGEMCDGVDETGQPLAGNPLELAFFSGESLGKMKGLARLLAGQPIGNVLAAAATVEASAGRVVRFSVTLGRDGKRRFVNTKEVVADTPAPAPAPTT